MKFLADQDVYLSTINFVRALGYEVVCAAEVGLSRAADMDILYYARQEGYILITRDKDFVALVFLQMRVHGGVIFLRVTFDTLKDVHEEMARLLAAHHLEELQNCFVTVELGRHRIRRAR